MISSVIAVGKIYNIEKTVNSVRNNQNSKSAMLWVKIDLQIKDSKPLNKVFFLWSNQVDYILNYAQNDDVVAIKTYITNKENQETGKWEERWNVRSIEIVGKPQNSNSLDYPSKVVKEQKLQFEKPKVSKEEQEMLDDDKILWD